MKKIFTILTLFAFTSTVSYSQISDRVNDESTYLLGARPQSGNFGFYLGLSTAEIGEITESNWEESGIPLVKVKYYYSDKLVLRAGVQVSKRRRLIEGKVKVFDAEDLDYKHVETDASWNFSLGGEKHFDLSNIFDSYIGLNSNFGYERSVRIHNESYLNGDFRDDEGSNFGFTYGLETFVGTNFFIADLPIAAGLELGFIAKNYGANKYKYKWDEQVAGTSNSGTYYTSLVDDFEDATANTFSTSNQFTDLKARRFDIMPLVRVSLTFFLKQ
jgi:hypothetical protein